MCGQFVFLHLGAEVQFSMCIYTFCAQRHIFRVSEYTYEHQIYALYIHRDADTLIFSYVQEDFHVPVCMFGPRRLNIRWCANIEVYVLCG